MIRIGSRKGYSKKAKIVVQTKKPVTFAKRVTNVVNRKKETKYHTNLAADDTFGNNDPGTNRITLEDLTDVAQSAGNSTDTTRIGDQIEIVGLKLKYLLAFNTSATYNDTVNRVIIFQWKGDEALTTADAFRVLQPGPSAAGTQDYNSLSHYAHDYRHMVNILYDKSFAMSDSAANPKTLFCDVKNISLKKAKKNIDYLAAGTGGINHIYIMVVGLLPELSSDITYDARIFFKDA